MLCVYFFYLSINLYINIVYIRSGSESQLDKTYLPKEYLGMKSTFKRELTWRPWSLWGCRWLPTVQMWQVWACSEINGTIITIATLTFLILREQYFINIRKDYWKELKTPSTLTHMSRCFQLWSWVITHPGDVMDVLKAACVAKDVVTAGAVGFKHRVTRRELKRQKKTRKKSEKKMRDCGRGEE